MPGTHADKFQKKVKNFETELLNFLVKQPKSEIFKKFVKEEGEEYPYRFNDAALAEALKTIRVGTKPEIPAIDELYLASKKLHDQALVQDVINKIAVPAAAVGVVGGIGGIAAGVASMFIKQALPTNATYSLIGCGLVLLALTYALALHNESRNNKDIDTKAELSITNNAMNILERMLTNERNRTGSTIG